MLQYVKFLLLTAIPGILSRRQAVAKRVLKNQIRRLRFEHGEMTQEELARHAGCTRQTINAVEAAKYGPSLELAFKIAQVFGVGIEDVFQYMDVEPK
jgi:putative transcriptional regulator